MRCSVLWVAAAALVLAGCGRERDEVADSAVDEYSITADTAEGYEGEGPAPITALPDTGTGLLVAGNLTAVNNSGVNGGVSLTEAAEGTRMYLNIAGAQPTTMVEVGIYSGDCRGVPGEAVAPPVPLEVGETGIATGTVTIPVDAAAIQDGRHSVQVYTERAGAPTPPVACAEIPAGGTEGGRQPAAVSGARPTVGVP